MSKEDDSIQISARNLGRPTLPLEVVLENEYLANLAPDSTKDSGPRPHTWNPPLISKEDWKDENPYRLGQ